MSCECVAGGTGRAKQEPMNLKRVVAVVGLLFAASIGATGCSTADSIDSSDDHLESPKDAPLARFAPYLATLRSAIETPATVEESAQALLASGRPAAFSLQALCRVYGGFEGGIFSELHDDFKALEDGIGAYDKWDGIYQQGVSQHADAATLDRLKKNRDDALVRFSSMLTSRQWRTDGKTPTRLATITKFLDTYKWLPRVEDREEILSWLSKEMSDLKTTKYDMKTLEQGNGLHELRRDLRWVLIEELTLNGMVGLKDAGEKCPVPAYAKIPNDNRYGALRTSAMEPNPCKISQCLVFAAADYVARIGELKDEAEQQVNIEGDSDVVPVSLQPQTQAIYDEMNKNDLFGAYHTELEACRAANK